jgi:hypothetical protein
VMLSRYEPGTGFTVVAHRGPHAAQLPPGSRARPDEATVLAMVRRTARPARMDNYEGAHGAIGDLSGP